MWHRMRTLAVVAVIAPAMTVAASAAASAAPARPAADPAATVEQGPVPAPPWGLDRIDQRRPPYDLRYSVDQTGAGVTVYVVDGGLRTTHQEFGGRAEAGFSAYPDAPADDAGACGDHGTHVASVVGGTTYGVAKEVRIVSVRVFDSSCFTDPDKVAEGIDSLTAHHAGPSVVNMSIGDDHDPAWAAVDDAVRRSIQAGVTYVAAAGNQSSDACSAHPA